MDTASHGTSAWSTATHFAPASAPAASAIGRHVPALSTTRKCSRAALEEKKSRRNALASMRWNGLV